MCDGNTQCKGCSEKNKMIFKGKLIKDSQEMRSQTVTDEGFLICDVVLSRTGIQQYKAFEMGIMDRDPYDIINVYRPDDEVFNDESMKSFEGKPVTDDHPPEFLTIDNVKTYQLGSVINNIEREDNKTISKIIITDKDLVSKVRSGKVQVSNGYTSDFDPTPGVTEDGEPYDFVQRNIRGNHVAIVSRGRCGDICKIQDHENGVHMSKSRFIKIKDAMVEVPEGAEDIVEELQEEIKEIKALLEEKTLKLDAEMASRESMQGKMDELEASKKDSDPSEKKDNQEEMDEEEIEKKAEERESVKDVAMRIAPNFNCKGKKVAEIKAAIISAKHNGLTLDGKSSEYINARYDAIAEEVEKTGSNRLNTAINDALSSVDGSVMGERDFMVQRNLNAYKGSK